MMSEDKKIILEKWKKFAKEYNIELNPDVDTDLKAEVCAGNGNACPCVFRIGAYPAHALRFWTISKKLMLAIVWCSGKRVKR